MTPTTVWCNARFDPPLVRRLQDGVGDANLLISRATTASNLVAAGDSDLARAEVAFGQPDVQQVIDLATVRWVHLTSAGYTRYDTDAVRVALRSRGGMLTTSSQVYALPCAEHALAFMLAHTRRLPECLANQAGPRAWESGAVRARSSILRNQRVLILGYGAIAQRLIELLAPLGPEVLAVRSRIRGDERVRTITPDQIDGLLPDADHVVNTLPHSPSTQGFVSRDRLALMKPHAAFYNVGRGDTVDQDALVEALQAGKIAAAYLDVTTPEPLPPDHVLWTLPNCVITPHSAGGHVGESERLVEHFLGNYARYTSGRDLLDRVI